MSKQEDAKKMQEWRKKGPTCADCVGFRSDIVKQQALGYGEWIKETNLHCAIGEFSTGKFSWCKEYEWKEG